MVFDKEMHMLVHSRTIFFKIHGYLKQFAAVLFIFHRKGTANKYKQNSLVKFIEHYVQVWLK